MRILSKLLAAIVLAGSLACAGGSAAQGLGTPLGFSDVLFTDQVQVGHLYFAGEGQRPAFATSKGVIYSELCSKDYKKTTALGKIGDYVETAAAFPKKRTITRGGGLALSAGKLAALIPKDFAFTFDASASQNFVAEGIRRLTLSDDGVDLVQSSIGKACRGEIAAMQKKKVTVVLVLAAQRADTLTEVKSLNGVFDFFGFGLKPHGTDEENTEYEGAYIAVHLGKFSL